MNPTTRRNLQLAEVIAQLKAMKLIGKVEAVR